MKSHAVALHDLGQSFWLDFISDGLIQSGELKRLIDAGSIYGVTSNPTIFKNAIAGDADSYPAEITRLAGAGKSAEEIFDELSARDIARTADLLLDTYRKGTGRDGRDRSSAGDAPRGRLRGARRRPAGTAGLFGVRLRSRPSRRRAWPERSPSRACRR